MLYYSGSGVNSVQVVLSGLNMRLLYFIHMCICCNYGCMYALAAFLLVCVYVMVMSSAYEVSFSGAGGCGMSDAWVRRRRLENASFKLALYCCVLCMLCLLRCSF